VNVEKMAFLRDMALFAGLDAHALEQLASIADPRAFKAGQPIYAEGESDAALFLVVKGAVKIDKQVNAEQQQTMAQIKAGEFFGIISFVIGGEHSVSAQAIADTELLLIRRTEFDKLAARNPAVGFKIVMKMSSELALLLRQMDDKFVELVGYIYGRSKK
jgi:CRP-like cAMP-binding protein